MCVFQFGIIVQSDGLVFREDFSSFTVDQCEIIGVILKTDTPVTATYSAGIVDCEVYTLATNRIIIATFNQALIIQRLVGSFQLHRTSSCTDNLCSAFNGH